MSNRPTRRVVLAALLGVLAVWALPARAADASADAFIERIGQQTVDILQQKQLPAPERAAQLKQRLNEWTDLEYIGRIVLARHWRSASEEQRREYLRLLDALVLQAMAERIDSYAGQSFEIVNSKKVDDQDTMVDTRIGQPGGGPTYNISWRVRKGEDGEFRLIDIIAEGISLVVTQRSEVNDIVGRTGVDGLLDEMRRRLAERDVTGNLPPT